MDILRRGEYGRRIRKAKQGGSVVPEAVGEKHCAGRRPLGPHCCVMEVVGAGFSLGLVSLWGLAQMLLSVFQMQMETYVEVTNCCKSC